MHVTPGAGARASPRDGDADGRASAGRCSASIESKARDDPCNPPAPPPSSYPEETPHSARQPHAYPSEILGGVIVEEGDGPPEQVPEGLLLGEDDPRVRPCLTRVFAGEPCVIVDVVRQDRSALRDRFAEDDL